jgi:hypothetical protein
MKYRKKPVVIEAFQYDGDLMNSDGNYCAPQWAVDALEAGVMYYDSLYFEGSPCELFIRTLERRLHVSVGDYVIKGVVDEIYSISEERFLTYYVPVGFCVVCGKEFRVRSKKHLCCCQKCNAALWRSNNPLKVKEQQKRNDEKRKGVYRYDSEVRKKWYQRKIEDKEWVNKVNSQAKSRKENVNRFLRKYKLQHGCADCGYKENHVALDFDHVVGEKRLDVCNAKSIAQAESEILKCEVVCSNCHRIRTWERSHSKTDSHPCKPDIFAMTYEPVEGEIA